MVGEDASGLLIARREIDVIFAAYVLVRDRVMAGKGNLYFAHVLSSSHTSFVSFPPSLLASLQVETPLS